MRIKLTVTAGPHKGETFMFAGHDTFLVGRSKRAHFRAVKDKYFSRIHFMIEVNPPLCQLMDMGSHNKTYVNGQAVETAYLKNGDRIRAGHTVLRVALEAGDQAPAAEPPSAPTPVQQATPPRTGKARPTPQPEPAVQVCRVCGGPVAPADDAAPPALCRACREEIRSHPQPIAGYQVIRELGHGTFGMVYLALREGDESLVALKMIIPAVTPKPADIARFQREARILYELDHPHIVACREVGESGGKLYFAMDYIHGTDAARLVKADGPMPAGRAVGLICQLLQALEYAHAKGFVHRDIKPSNLLVTEHAGREGAMLADFGLARVYQDSQLSGLTMTGDIGGTVAFMAPEQITNFRHVKPTADQYATGATLYNLLTDRLVYDFPTQVEQQLSIILRKKPVPVRSRRPDIPEELAAVIDRSLAKAPQQRFADVKEMRRALLKFGR
ncbi:MAG TPA: FHA domain-containing serine/threonine-protein kinase [Gemmataceae bacterium]|jgi:serine/threonine-protein kinase|nr:FHA domain-containing serine/threonine-protein kinase [Gemmataceae bacterium]